MGHTKARKIAEAIRQEMADGRYRAGARSRELPSAASLVHAMPPVYEQAMRGTCVANAVTALLEYYEDCRTRLSVQYLFAASAWVMQMMIALGAHLGGA